MGEFHILVDPLYQRGKEWLSTKINSPDDLYTLWKVFGSWRSKQVPDIEKCFPWWEL